MILIKGIILCEGDSDQILIGAYLSSTKELIYKNMKNLADDPFPGERINWYSDKSNKLIGIWNIGGCDFVPAIHKIMHREIMDHIIEKIAIVTDNDDEEAENTRPEEIYRAINEVVKIENFSPDDCTDKNNKWQNIEFEGSFDQQICIRYCYLLVPYDSQGALETFMLNALAEESASKKDAIKQVKEFIRNFKSEKYLRKRRERIKSELGVSISVFNPERMFDTMMELINQVDWTAFDRTEKQFGILKDII